MSFKNYYLKLSVGERESLALQAGTTRGTLNQVVYAGKQIELGLADCLTTLCAGIALDDLPLTDRAKQQQLVRRGSEFEPDAQLKTTRPELVPPQPQSAQPATNTVAIYPRKDGTITFGERATDVKA